MRDGKPVCTQYVRSGQSVAQARLRMRTGREVCSQCMDGSFVFMQGQGMAVLRSCRVSACQCCVFAGSGI